MGTRCICSSTSGPWITLLWSTITTLEIQAITCPTEGGNSKTDHLAAKAATGSIALPSKGMTEKFTNSKILPRIGRRAENRVPLPGWRGTYFKGKRNKGALMIETTHISIKNAAAMLDTDITTLLIAATEGRIGLFGFVPDYVESDLLLTNPDPWAKPVVISRSLRFVGFAPLSATKAAVILGKGRVSIRAFTEAEPLPEEIEEELRNKYERTEWSAYWALPPRDPYEQPPIVGRDDLYLKRVEIEAIQNKKSVMPTSPVQPETFAASGHFNVSDALALLNRASRHWWANAERGDPGTQPTNAEVAKWLEGQGVSPSRAKHAASIIRPEWAHNGRKPDV